MPRTADILFTDLRYLIDDLGKDGGLISPSVYDTAQVIRLMPPQEGMHQAIEWLLRQQQPDGGWGELDIPRARDLPTLAAILALYAYRGVSCVAEAMDRGLRFLRRQAIHWAGPLPDDIPIGIELLLPSLLAEAAHLDLGVAQEPYAGLIELGQRRRRLIHAMRPGAGTTAVHSWEAWGHDPDPALLDASDGIGHSPAATAAWLHMAADLPGLADARERARCYLHNAAAATGTGIPGVVSTVWPIARFEQLFGLYALLLAGLLNQRFLRDAVQPQIEDLIANARPDGYSFSDFFAPDGDDTAAALAIFQAVGHQADLKMLRQYENDDHFCTWHQEMQPSLSATARAIEVLMHAGEAVTQPQRYLVSRQASDGRWSTDKWNASWLYTTLHAVLALARSRDQAGALKRATHALLTYQHSDGGWGMHNASTAVDTAYGILALHTLRQFGMADAQVDAALARAARTLLNNYRPFAFDKACCWIGKELYRPYRVDTMFELSAMLASYAHAQCQSNL